MSQLDFLMPTSPRSSPDGIERSAEFSLDMRYRYRLTRTWAVGPVALFVMLNPSTADATKDDPTICKCIKLARSWGCGALDVVNLFALISSDPAALFSSADPVGAPNDKIIGEALRATVTSGGRIVVAWGAILDFADPKLPPVLRGRDEVVLARLAAAADVHCLGRTASGAPIHPAARGKHRVPDNAQPVIFRAKGGA